MGTQGSSRSLGVSKHRNDKGFEETWPLEMVHVAQAPACAQNTVLLMCLLTGSLEEPLSLPPCLCYQGWKWSEPD